jgi:hypothetical protein
MSNRVREVATGRGRGKILQLEIYTRDLLAIKLKGGGERTATPLLTKEQAIALRAALDELIPEIESATAEKEPYIKVVETKREAA